MSRTKKSRACSHLPHLTSHKHTHTRTHTECGRENIVLWGMTGTLTPKEMLLPDASVSSSSKTEVCVCAHMHVAQLHTQRSVLRQTVVKLYIVSRVHWPHSETCRSHFTIHSSLLKSFTVKQDFLWDKVFNGMILAIRNWLDQ